MVEQRLIEERGMSTVEKAEKVLSELQGKRTRLIARGVEVGDQRAAIAYDAHAAGDPKAEKCMAPSGITTAFGSNLGQGCRE
jgi:hypothetical protein